MEYEDMILDYWSSLIGLSKSEMEGIKNQLIKTAKDAYKKYYYREISNFTIFDYIDNYRYVEHYL